MLYKLLSKRVHKSYFQSFPRGSETPELFFFYNFTSALFEIKTHVNRRAALELQACSHCMQHRSINQSDRHWRLELAAWSPHVPQCLQGTEEETASTSTRKLSSIDDRDPTDRVSNWDHKLNPNLDLWPWPSIPWEVVTHTHAEGWGQVKTDGQTDGRTETLAFTSTRAKAVANNNAWLARPMPSSWKTFQSPTHDTGRPTDVYKFMT